MHRVFTGETHTSPDGTVIAEVAVITNRGMMFAHRQELGGVVVSRDPVPAFHREARDDEEDRRRAAEVRGVPIRVVAVAATNELVEVA